LDPLLHYQKIRTGFILLRGMWLDWHARHAGSATVISAMGAGKSAPADSDDF
jgi:hypothetical protein